ncbi:MAG: sugar ABC transporter substrate-binding protein [Oscillospiraceae bacterium]|nr:sugar ABC transporter substrate-binding protein [Oscillospiraceae bacterium]
MKKLVALLTAALLSIGIFAACAQKAPASEVQAPSAPSALAEKKEPVELNFYYWDEIQKDSMDKIVQLFEAKNPHITVVPTIVPWGQYWTKLQTALPSGVGPDVFWMNDRLPEFVSANLIMDLQPSVDAKAIDVANFPAALAGIFTVDGKLMAVPKDYSTIGIYYNKALFDKAKVAYPSDNWTWDEFLEAAKKLTVPGETFGFPATTSGQGCMNNFILQNNGALAGADGSVKVNSPETAEAIQFLYDMISVHKVSPTNVEMTENPPDTMFLAGKIAMISGGSWSVKDYAEVLGDNLGIAPLPKKAKQACVISGLGFAGAASTKHPEETKLFLEFCATQEAQEAMAEVVIPAFSGADKKWLENFPATLNTKAFVDASKYGMVLPPFKGNNNSVRKFYSDEIVKVWDGTKDVKTALADAEKLMNEEIAKLTK